MRDLAAPPDFRFVLRNATRDDHARVDALVTALEIDTRDGFARFARVHLACFGAMERVAGSAALDAMIAALAADLQTVAPGAVPPAATLGPVDALAAAYMIEGSRMGTRVLHGRWKASTDPAVRAADSYFGLPTEKGAWRAVTEALARVPVDTPRSARIESDTRRIFALFADVLERT